MKKLIALITASLIASGAFAAIELDASNYVMPLNFQTVDFDSGSKDIYAVVPFGFEVKSTFYLVDDPPKIAGRYTFYRILRCLVTSYIIIEPAQATLKEEA